MLCAGAAAADDHAALLDEAVARIDWDFQDSWAYTQSAVHDDRIWVGRYDPRLPDGERWTLISVDGAAPDEAEIEAYLGHKAERDPVGERGVRAIVEPDTLELVDETDEYWLFTFTPDHDHDEFGKHVESSLSIVKDGRYVGSVELRNKEPFNPGFGTRISEFLTRITFGPAIDGGPIVPRTVDVAVKGRAFFVIAIDDREAYANKDFEYAGD